MRIPGFYKPRFNFLDFLSNILGDSTVQGLKFVGATGLRSVERIFWIISVSTCIVLSGYLVHNIVTKFYANPVIISFQPDETTIQQIPFPAITLCNVNLLKRSEFSYLFDNLTKLIGRYSKLKVDSETFELGIALENLVQYCLSSPSFQRKTGEELRDITGRQDFIQEVQDLLVSVNTSDTAPFLLHLHAAIRKALEAYNKTAVNCHDMILQCAWSGKKEPCNKIFFSVDTRDGRCCVFNMMPRFILQNIPREEWRAKREERKYDEAIIKEWESFSLDHIIRSKDSLPTSNYPRYQSAGGKPYGLSILVNPELDEYSTCTMNDAYGFTITAHSHLSLPSATEHGAAIPPTSEVFVEIDADVTDADYKAIKDLKIESRECLLPTDKEAELKHFNMYTAENCLAECIANLTWLNCSCVQNFMPRNSSQSVCGAKRRSCADDVFYNITSGVGEGNFCEHCRPSCTEIEYKVQVSHFDLRDEVSDTPFPYSSYDGSVKNASNYSIIHVYFGIDTLHVKERKSLYNIWDLISDAGSLLGFTLGISIVSFIEFIYFFTLRLYFKYRSSKKDQRSSLKNENWNNWSQSQKSSMSKFDMYGAKVKAGKSLTLSRSNAFSGSMIYPYIK